MKTSADCECDISIIVASYRSERYLKNGLASVYDKIASQASCEIIVVNNDAHESLAEIRSLFPDVKIIDHKKNIGFGAANNLGAKMARGRYLFFLNPDSEIISDNIGQVLDEFESNEDIGAIGSQLINYNGKIQEWSAGFEASLPDLIRNNLGRPRSRKIWRSREKIAADWIAGTAMMVKKELFKSVGAFDNSFFMYFEDMDLCKRIRIHGKRIIYFPGFKIKHLEGGSYQNQHRQKKNYYDSQEYYFKKNRPKFEYWAVKIIRKILLCQ
jgi:GT2 family glycosyltransferase